MSKYDFKLNIDENSSHTKILRRVKPNSKVLEFGPAHGVMTRYMREVLNCDIYAVELDKEAAQDCSQFCKDMVVGSIEDYSWKHQFADIKFDFIIFADVLEHLYDPWRVLKEVKEFLSPIGTVLVSLPNIAHNAIIMNLLEDKFEYQSVGLLDDTHIRFFTEPSIRSMIANCGYKATYFDTIRVEPEHTEFKKSYMSLSDEVVDTLINKPNGTVYQFIFEICEINANLVEYDFENYTRKLYKYTSGAHMQLFYYQNNEVNVPDVRTQYFDDELQTLFRFELENIENLTHIRIDLSNFPVVANLEHVKIILADSTEHILQNCYNNANFVNGNSYTYLHDDPINVYYVAPLNILPQKLAVEISVDLHPVKRNEVMNLANQITTKQNNQLYQNQQNISHLSNELSNTQNELSNTQNELSSTQNEMSSTQNELSSTQNELSSTQNELSSAQKELSSTQNELSNTQNELVNVYNSKSWKITKPLRGIIKLFKLK